MLKTTLLAILDGWGVSDIAENNAIALANAPNYKRFLNTYSNTLLNASGVHVGLPDNQMGNSEVGHLNIGAGRVVKQILPRINEVVASGDILGQVEELSKLVSLLKLSGQTLHLFGLLSPGGIHSHQSHIEAIYDAAVSAGVSVKMHAFTDGRDTPPKSALSFLDSFLNNGARTIDSVGGRFFAMDRDNRWERVEHAFKAICYADAPKYSSVMEYVKAAYDAGETDEFITPAVSREYAGIKDGDAILVLNFRADRVREILTAILDTEFNKFKRLGALNISKALGMVAYSQKLNEHMGACFKPLYLPNTLGEYVSAQGLTQLRVAETEKYAHVTFFLNGGREDSFEGEERALVPSPNVKTYDLQPEMSANAVTEAVLDNIGKYDLIVVNYANPDMVGHTGNLSASIKSVEVIDSILGQLEDAVLSVNGTLCITADHGNIEKMWDDDSDQEHTAHTNNLVPFIVVSEKLNDMVLSGDGALCDVAPTVLALMQQGKPEEMTGRCLITK